MACGMVAALWHPMDTFWFEWGRDITWQMCGVMPTSTDWWQSKSLEED